MNFKIITGIAILFFFFNLNLSAQKVTQAKAHFSTKTDTLKGDFSTLGIFLVDVKLKANGKTYKFLVDTGAPTAVSSEIANEIAFDTATSATVNALDKKAESIAFVTVDSIFTGNTVFTNQTAFVWKVENTKILNCAGIDGILGSNTMNSCQVVFDWQNAQMIIANKPSDLNLPKTENQIKVHFQGKQKAPYIYTSKPKTRFLLDTGFNGYINFMINQKKQIEDLPYVNLIYTSVGSPAEGAFGYMEPDSSFMYSLHDFQFANLSIDSVEIEITPGRIPKIGNELLKNYLVHLNPKKKRLYFYPNLVQNHYPETSFGISILPNDSSYFVSSIDIGGIAHSKDIELNDVVLNINDVLLSPIEEVPCSALFEIRKLTKKSKTLKVVVQKNDGTIKTIKLNKNIVE